MISSYAPPLNLHTPHITSQLQYNKWQDVYAHDHEVSRRPCANIGQLDTSRTHTNHVKTQFSTCQVICGLASNGIVGKTRFLGKNTENKQKKMYNGYTYDYEKIFLNRLKMKRANGGLRYTFPNKWMIRKSGYFQVPSIFISGLIMLRGIYAQHALLKFVMEKNQFTAYR